METFDTGTNLFDQALAESVLESLDFAYSDNIKWICIQYVMFTCLYYYFISLLTPS